MKIMDSNIRIINWPAMLISAGLLKYLGFKEFFEKSLADHGTEIVPTRDKKYMF